MISLVQVNILCDSNKMKRTCNGLLAHLSPRLKDIEEKGREMKDKGSHHGAMD